MLQQSPSPLGDSSSLAMPVNPNLNAQTVPALSQTGLPGYALEYGNYQI